MDNISLKFCIVGAGSNGVEIAYKLSDRLSNKGEFFLIERRDTLAKNFDNGIQQAAKKAVARRKIKVLIKTLFFASSLRLQAKVIFNF